MVLKELVENLIAAENEVREAQLSLEKAVCSALGVDYPPIHGDIVAKIGTYKVTVRDCDFTPERPSVDFRREFDLTDI